jgi:arylsulfatase A-like enzyme
MLLLVSGFLCWGCSRSPRRLNVILISLDTLRADRLGAYGYGRETSPALDALAAHGALFENVVAETSWTLPSHATMLSGLFPSTHGAVLPSLKPGSGTIFLAERLRAAGYRTLGLTDGGYVGARYGFDRGFDTFDDSEKGLEATLTRAESYLNDLPPHDRFFLFLHTYDIHCPYTPAAPYAGVFKNPSAEFIETEGRCGNPHYNGMVLSDGQVRYLSDRYDESIREADGRLGAFFARLEKAGRLRETVVLVTSDHGEEFHEHGQIGHERSLYRELLSIPLVVAGPSIPAGRRTQAAGLVDIVPTVLSLAGLPSVADVEGRDLFAETSPTWPRFSELSWQLPLSSITTDEYQLVINRDTGIEELYAHQDWRQQENLAERRTSTAVSLKRQLHAFAQKHSSGSAEPLDVLTPVQREQLKRLGYLD